MTGFSFAFRLPCDGLPRAVVTGPWSFEGAAVTIGGDVVLTASDRPSLEGGVSAGELGLRLEHGRLRLTWAGEEAIPESRLSSPPTRSAWLHAVLALLASLFGFAASALYLAKARSTGDPWPLRMAIHMAAWHLLLALTLFPASVWGQRAGIRVVQVVSAVFFAIHAGIALSNAEGAGADLPIAVLNALSGLGFLAAALHGRRAFRDMDPCRAVPRGGGSGVSARA